MAVAELLSGDWAAGVHEVCTAILDRATCQFCWKEDGRIEALHSASGERPPFHGRCRCMMVTIFIPEKGARKLAGAQIDYAELKEDIRDYMRTAQVSLGIGLRHAHAYIGETLETSSPEALTRRLMNRRGYFPKSGRK